MPTVGPPPGLGGGVVAGNVIPAGGFTGAGAAPTDPAVAGLCAEPWAGYTGLAAMAPAAAFARVCQTGTADRPFLMA